MLDGGTDREDRADSSTAAQARCKQLTVTRQIRLLSDSRECPAAEGRNCIHIAQQSAEVITQIYIPQSKLVLYSDTSLTQSLSKYLKFLSILSCLWHLYCKN